MRQVRFASRALSALFAVVLSLLPDCSCDNLGRIALSAPQSGGGRQFIDAEQRQRFFHGINAVVKGPPWIPAAAAFDAQTSLCDYDMQLLQSLGVNVIRLGVMWPAVEPVEGVYNDTYLEAVASIVTNAASHGIYTLLDMHQDSLSELFCGEGVPAWALLHMRNVLPLPEPIGPRFNDSDYETDSCGIPGCRWPTRQACAAHSWGSMQFSDACGQGYSELWHTGGSDFERSLLFKWASVLAHVAAYFKNFTSVLGLEIVNEPFPGNVFRDPLLLLPGWADAHVLQAAYNLAVPVIRKSNNDILIFFAGTTWSNLGDGFVQVPGGADYSNRSVLAFHYYEPPQIKESERFDFRRQLAVAKFLQCGAMLTEFGSPGYNGGFENDTMTAEEDGLSYIFWEWKDFCHETEESLAGRSQWAAFGACKTGFGDGTPWNGTQPADNIMRSMTRTYAPAVAGSMTSVSFSSNTSLFSLTFQPAAAGPPPTLIYLHEALHYPLGVTIRLLPLACANVTHVPGSNLVKIVVNAPVPRSVTVTITNEAA